MLKFKPEDFDSGYDSQPTLYIIKTVERAQRIFDAWIKENGKVVYSEKLGQSPHEREIWTSWVSRGIPAANPGGKKALIICEEPIEKCTHPLTKINMYWGEGCNPETKYLKCECGAKVRPKEYEAV